MPDVMSPFDVAGHDQCSALVDPAPAHHLHTVGGGAAARRLVITGIGGVRKMAAAAHSSIWRSQLSHKSIQGNLQRWLSAILQARYLTNSVKVKKTQCTETFCNCNKIPDQYE